MKRVGEREEWQKCGKVRWDMISSMYISTYIIIIKAEITKSQVPGAGGRFRQLSGVELWKMVANLTDGHPQDWMVEHGRQEKRVFLRQAWFPTVGRAEKE